MSGRGGGRRGGRGGRGGRRTNTTKFEKKKKTLEDYVFYIGSSKQASDFETTSEFVINHIKMTFDRGNDIAETLRNLEKADTDLWKPSLKASSETDPDKKERENRQFEMEYKAELDEAMKRKRVYEDNLFKAYATIWQRCAKGMKSKIEARSDYESAVYNDPILLLKAIREHALNYQETRYEMSIISDAFRMLFGTRQKDHESLQDYTRRYKTAREVLESHLGEGKLLLPKYTKSMPGYDENNPSKIEACATKASEMFFAFVYLENCDQDKYGSIMKNLNSQKSLGNDQYPKTLIESNNVLSNHKFDMNKTRQPKHQQKQQNKKKDEDDKGDDDSPPLSFAQLEGKCYCCGKTGHKSPDCRDKDKIPREQWAIHKLQQFAQTATEDTKTASNESSSRSSGSRSTISSKKEQHIGWAGVHCAFLQTGPDLRDFILLDSDSTDSIFCKKEYVTNIHDVDETLEVVTNGGPMYSNQKCYVPKLGAAWFNEKSITNIISLSQMCKKHRVSFDSDNEPAFLVHMPNKIVRFGQMPNGLFGMNPNDPKNYIKIKTRVQLLETVGENLTFLTPRQREKARRARKLHHALGTPTADDLKAMIRMNLIRNNEVTTEDINLATKTFGPDVATIKGKSTRRKPVPAQSNLIEIPEELLEVHEDVTLSIDGMTVNSLKFLTTISHNLYYRTVQYVSRPVASVYALLLDEVVKLYKRAGFRITTIHCDNEFHKVMDDWAAKQDPPIHVNYAAAQEHVPRAERNNRTIQERIRVTYHYLPYTHLPRIMVKIMSSEAGRKLNYFPNKHGVSKYYSPRMLLHHENLDYRRHCQFAFGDYVAATDEPNPMNTNAARALDCVYLRPTASAQGGHELLHLQTNAIITRHRCTQIPITPAVIRQIHAMAHQDAMPSGLKIQNRTNAVLFDSAWIAGVHYDEQEFHDSDYETDDEPDGNDDDFDDEDYDEMDENEIAEILADPNEFNIPRQRNNNNPNDPDDGDDGDDSSGEDSDDDDSADDDSESDHTTNDDNEEPEEDQVSEPRFENPEPEHEIVFETDDEEYEDSDDEDEELEADEEEDPNPGLRRSSRVRTPNPRYVHLNARREQTEEYSVESARIIAMIIGQFNMTMVGMIDDASYAFLQTYSLKQGIKKFGQRGKAAAHKEMKQLHDRVVFTPISLKGMTAQERKRAMESLIFLVEKRDGRIKARTCANGSTQRSYIDREEAASPTAGTDAIIVTAVIDAKQMRDIMTIDIPNAFVQTPIPEKGEKIIMKIRGALVDMLCEICPGVYDDHVVYEGKHKVLYVQMLKALYGMMIASILYYKKFKQDIESIGFELNPYDACVANRTVNGEQHTVTWHVDDVKSSHVDPTVNDEFYHWCESTYGSEETGHVTQHRGKVHDYLAMILDYSVPGAVKIDMRYYIEGMMKEFPYQLNRKVSAPWTEKLMKIDDKAKKLDEKRRKVFHTFVMKIMFMSKRARPDVNPAIAFLASRVKEPNEGDWNKLLRVLNFLKRTKEDILTLEADEHQTIYWYVDAAFAVHPDMKSHTGAVFTLGKGAIVSDSTKQKVNSRSSTEAELIGVDDEISKILWSKRFIEHQGFEVMLNIVYQDNTSTMKLEKNGKASSGKRTRHFDIKFFYVTDLINRDEVTVIYCPTDEMIADYNTKPVVGAKFVKFRRKIMNLKK